MDAFMIRILFQLFLLIIRDTKQSVVAHPNLIFSTLDGGVHYATISIFNDEWFSITNNTEFAHSPVHIWLRCVDREVRGYLFSEDLKILYHGKEAEMPNAALVRDFLVMKADGNLVSLRSGHGGVDLFFNISQSVNEEHLVDITFNGVKHYTRFPVSMCQKPKTPTVQTKYIMHIHLKDHLEPMDINHRTIEGIANHAIYHRCALKLARYEVVIQREQLSLFLANHKIMYLVSDGYLHFLLRNPFVPSPLHMPNQASNCYYQAYTQNLAILQHWKENTKIYFWDSDEYMNFDGDLTAQGFMDLVEAHSALGFDRYMTFCKSCTPGKPEIKHLSFTHSKYIHISKPLDHPKLVVDPNRVGCYIVHWAGCGDETHIVPIKTAHILHFENLYAPRWTEESRAVHGHEVNVTANKMNLLCDPGEFDWKSNVLSFHD